MVRMRTVIDCTFSQTKISRSLLQCPNAKKHPIFRKKYLKLGLSQGILLFFKFWQISGSCLFLRSLIDQCEHSNKTVGMIPSTRKRKNAGWRRPRDSAENQQKLISFLWFFFHFFFSLFFLLCISLPLVWVCVGEITLRKKVKNCVACHKRKWHFRYFRSFFL